MNLEAASQELRAVRLQHCLDVWPCGSDQPRQLQAENSVGRRIRHSEFEPRVFRAVFVASDAETKSFSRIALLHQASHRVTVNVPAAPFPLARTEVYADSPLAIQHRLGDEVGRNFRIPELRVIEVLAIRPIDAAPPPRLARAHRRAPNSRRNLSGQVLQCAVEHGTGPFLKSEFERCWFTHGFVMALARRLNNPLNSSAPAHPSRVPTDCPVRHRGCARKPSAPLKGLRCLRRNPQRVCYTPSRASDS